MLCERRTEYLMDHLEGSHGMADRTICIMFTQIPSMCMEEHESNIELTLAEYEVLALLRSNMNIKAKNK